MKKIKYCLFLIASFMFICSNLSAESDFRFTQYETITLETADEYQINYTGDISFVTLVSSNEEVATVSDTGIITPIADGFTLIYVKTDALESSTSQLPVIVTKDGELKSVLEDAINSFTSLNVNFSKDLMTHDFEVVNDDGYTWTFENYGRDYIISYTPAAPKDVSFICSCTETSCEVYAQYYFTYAVLDGTAYVDGPKSTTKTIPIIFPNDNEEDKTYVNNFAKSLDRVYYSYINSNPYEKFNIDKLIENASFHEVFKQFGIDYKLDIRKGDDTPESAMVGGHIVLGKNGVYYTARQLDIYRTLKVPTNSGMSIIEMIIKYFKDYVLSAGETVRVEHVSNNQLSFLERLSEIILPTLNADTEKTITFLVEEIPNSTNPGTNDNIYLYITIACITLIILSFGLLLKKKIF